LLHDNPNAQTVLNVQEGVLDAIRETDFALVVRPVDRHSPQMLEDIRAFLEKQRLHGVLILPPISENDDLAALCRELDCGYVRMGSATLDDHEHLVQSNDREAVAKAVDYLVEMGHRRIGLIAGPDGFRSAAERRAGFTSAMKRHGLDVPDELVAEGTYRFDSGIAAGVKLLQANALPTAIYSCNDEMAAGALRAIREAGLKVPEDISIIGFDDSPIAAHIWPPMTTVGWPIQAMAKAAAMKLIDVAEAAQQPSFFESELVHRASVARPSGNSS
ncbi:MAG: substrate-binding domain-containing protein, partial [Pontixanthobacter sp.]